MSSGKGKSWDAFIVSLRLLGISVVLSIAAAVVLSVYVGYSLFLEPEISKEELKLELERTYRLKQIETGQYQGVVESGNTGKE